jgi:cellulose synthase/poly-beta-1,6-N-acetylglucosamine synthase-like glycosyltransferase
VTSLFLETVVDWELAALAVTLVLSGYLIAELLIAVLRPWPRAPPDPDRALPFVSVVIPTYDEPNEILRATIESWEAVRYPAFEVILADDSTEPVRLDSTRVRVLRRHHREGFKGGALRDAFDHLHPLSEWMFVFDADYVVDPDVLVRFSDHFRPGVGGIQGFMRMGLNDRPSILTRFSEALHEVAGVLLAGRYRYRGFVGVQGTVQAYRVEAIRAMGGLAPQTTANEDLDTSFRLRKAGWAIVYDPTIAGRGIAPERYSTFFTQISRWTATTVREYRRHWVSFARSRHVPLGEKIDSVLFLLTWTNAIVVAPTMFFIPWALLYLHLIPLWLAISITFLPAAVFLIPTLAHRTLRLGLVGWLWYYVLLIPGSFVMLRAAVSGFVGEPGFARTPKVAGAPGAVSAHTPSVPWALDGSSCPTRPFYAARCRACGTPLPDETVVFYATAGLDVEDVECRACLSHVEWQRFRTAVAARPLSSA